MRWDPLGAWPNERRWMWLTFCVWMLILRGPSFVGDFLAKPYEESIPDFFQEYASARNWFEGISVYTDHRLSVPHYLDVKLNVISLVVVNAHPPTSILLALPFAKLEFPWAFLAWNLVSLAALVASLWIVQRQLKIPLTAWSLAPLAGLFLLCYPLGEQIRMGQLTLILLLLLTGTWAAERSERPWLAGALLGSAMCIKLFPGFLFLYYALRGRWRVVAAGLVTAAALTDLTVLILGLESYRSYFVEVLPSIQWFRAGWNNDSLWGFWSRLFDPSPEHERLWHLTAPLFYSPALALSLSLISAAAVAGILAWAVRSDAKNEKSDLTFAMAVTAMLLVSPVCWEHYLLLLLVPLAIVWTKLSASRLARARS